ncbi:MAG: CHAT domain-containing protein [Candidatus Xenobiia bacterium LiM19]
MKKGASLILCSVFLWMFFAWGHAWSQVSRSLSTGRDRASASLKIENPLLRSGLVLAGANRLGKEQLPEGCEDGVLTALEISGLPLGGTNLVVLSTCDTGLGKVNRGEGVFGLGRAFHLAGARTVVMSLWNVPDRETQELMAGFYERLKKGEGKAQALQGASIAILKERRDKFGTAHPFFWAPFICVGEP